MPRGYHSGDTGDAAGEVARITAHHGRPPFAAIGYSLGGNVLLKWLGECGAAAPFMTAVAVSVPFDLAACAERLAEGASRFYQWHLVRSMQARFTAKFGTGDNPLGITDIKSLDSVWRFDDAVSAPLHGFRDVQDYYARASCRQFLKRIAQPTLILHAVDDPFVPATAIPCAAEPGAEVSLELAAHGGHVGFITGAVPGRARYWLEARIIAHLDKVRAGAAHQDASYNARNAQAFDSATPPTTSKRDACTRLGEWRGAELACCLLELSDLEARAMLGACPLRSGSVPPFLRPGRYRCTSTNR